MCAWIDGEGIGLEDLRGERFEREGRGGGDT